MTTQTPEQDPEHEQVVDTDNPDALAVTPQDDDYDDTDDLYDDTPQTAD